MVNINSVAYSVIFFNFIQTFENRNPEIDLACDTALLFLSVEFCAASGGVVSSKV